MEETGAAIARMEERINNLCTRMDRLETLTESVNTLALSIRDLTNQQIATAQRVDVLTADVNEIKDRPAKNWQTVVAAIISALVGAGIALIIK